MKKFALFALSFGASIFMFVIIVVIVLLASKSLGFSDEQSPSTQQDNNRLSVDTVPPTNSLDVLVVFEDGFRQNSSVNSSTNLDQTIENNSEERLLFSFCEMDLEDKEVKAEQVILESGLEQQLIKLYKDGAIYSMLDRLSNEKNINFHNFIIFDGESFAKTTDRLNGLVYNVNNEEVLLTGSQAVKQMNGEFLSFACCELFKRALEQDVKTELGYIIEIAKSDISLKKLLPFSE